MNPAPNLFFIGPMGAGKTTLGRRVAALLDLPFHDLDRQIELASGATVALIFELEGEAGFRRRESAALAELVARSGIVLATGGGVVRCAENRERLRQRGFVVYLEATVDQQLARLAQDRSRPLLATPDRRERLRALAAEREPWYRELADLTVPAATTRSAARTAEWLAEELRRCWRRAAPGAAA
jgi:shikimate kinase